MVESRRRSRCSGRNAVRLSTECSSVYCFRITKASVGQEQTPCCALPVAGVDAEFSHKTELTTRRRNTCLTMNAADPHRHAGILKAVV